MPATDDVAGVYAQGRQLWVGDPDEAAPRGGQTLTVSAARAFKGGLIVSFTDVRDRNAAELLRGRALLIRADEARPLETGEYFLHDLAGLEVETEAGERLGRVREVYEGGVGHYLGVDDGERERLIPFEGRIVRDVDLARRRIIIAPPPGLLDL